MADEEKNISMSPSFNNGGSPTVPGSNTPLEFPSSGPSNPNGSTSSIQFPVGSPDALDSPRPLSRVRSRFNSHGDFEVATPFIRSRVQSRLDNVIMGEPGWRTRRESTAYVFENNIAQCLISIHYSYAQELNLTSMLHLKIMLRQMLMI
jgi:1-phosphatidylinositol-3-phosphate 5-kinase